MGGKIVEAWSLNNGVIVIRQLNGAPTTNKVTTATEKIRPLSIETHDTGTLYDATSQPCHSEQREESLGEVRRGVYSESIEGLRASRLLFRRGFATCLPETRRRMRGDHTSGIESAPAAWAAARGTQFARMDPETGTRQEHQDEKKRRNENQEEAISSLTPAKIPER